MVLYKYYQRIQNIHLITHDLYLISERTVARPTDDELDIDIALKNKTGESYDAKTDIYVVVYGVEGT